MSRTVCFIDKEGGVGTCCVEGLTGKQYNTIDCHKCSFYRKFKGRESEEFVYCDWLGEIKEGEKKRC